MLFDFHLTTSYLVYAPVHANPRQSASISSRSGSSSCLVCPYFRYLLLFFFSLRGRILHQVQLGPRKSTTSLLPRLATSFPGHQITRQLALGTTTILLFLPGSLPSAIQGLETLMFARGQQTFTLLGMN